MKRSFKIKIIKPGRNGALNILSFCIGIIHMRNTRVLIHQVCEKLRKIYHGNDPGRLSCVINEPSSLYQSESKSYIKCSCGIRTTWNQFLHLHMAHVKLGLLGDSGLAQPHLHSLHTCRLPQRTDNPRNRKLQRGVWMFQ